MPIFENEEIAGYSGQWEGRPFILCAGCHDYPNSLTEDGIEKFFEYKTKVITKTSLRNNPEKVFVCDACQFLLFKGKA